MRRIILGLLLSTSLALIGCEKKIEEPIGFNNDNVIIDIFSNETFISYAIAYNYTNGNNYFLELSVNIPNTDASSTKKVLKGEYFKIKENTKILTDSILIEEVKEQLGVKTKDELNKLEYTATIYNVEKDKIADGTGMTKKIFIEK